MEDAGFGGSSTHLTAVLRGNRQRLVRKTVEASEEKLEKIIEMCTTLQKENEDIKRKMGYLLEQVAHFTCAHLPQEFRKYAMEILERAHMVGCNPSRTPVDTESKLGDGGTSVVDPTLYRSLGTLNYGLQLFSSTTDSLITYSDVDWAGCPTTRQSTLGSLFNFTNRDYV
uniref:Ribonuclease H-like domain-containing protein n=1 Tax=Tanacetum cinerariifolium TaxID=118510 RepID=A0A6L2P4X8_TANCI|nr:ribonuclease H-like domain-containing protein [Tanacetum cinerariifolium]